VAVTVATEAEAVKAFLSRAFGITIGEHHALPHHRNLYTGEDADAP
jgi:hypothetical protein